MDNFPIVHQSLTVRRRLRQWRGSRYLWLALSSYGLLALVVLLYLARTPSYESRHALVLPGSGSSSNFNIENIGTANQDTRTPFGSVEFSPLANYREIIRSKDLLASAAASLGMSHDEFASPKVELRERTSILVIHSVADSPALAQQINWALYEAFQAELERLRADEVSRRDEGITRVLASYYKKLETTRQAIVTFQQNGLLVSTDQMTQLMASLAQIKDRRLTLTAEVAHKQDYVHQLTRDLGVSPAMAGRVLVLQSDAAFRGLLKELDNGAAMVAEYASRWGSEHPKVVAQNLRYDSALNALKQRTQTLVGLGSDAVLATTNLSAIPERAQLFASLLDNYALLQGASAQLHETARIEQQLTDRLKIYAREAAELERLQREHALAEAVFTSAAARLEASRADIFASYPAVQLLSMPTLPHKAKNPNPLIAAAMAGMGILFISIGLLILWHRSRLLQLVLKNT